MEQTHDKALALLVEDDLLLRDTLYELMCECGFDVVAKEDDQDAFEWLTSSKQIPQVIVTGLRKYGDDESSFIDKLDQRRAWRGVPVVVFSAYPHVDRKSRHGGFLRCLHCPADSDQFTRVLRELMADCPA